MDFLKRAKNEMFNLSCSVYSEMQADKKNLKRSLSVGIVLAIAVCCCTVAFANGAGISDLGKEVTDILTEVYQQTRTIITVFAAIMLGFAFFVRMTANQQSAANATKWIIRILVAYAGYFCIGLILSVIQNSTSEFTDLPE